MEKKRTDTSEKRAILLVEDEMTTSVFMQKIIRENGYDVHTVTTGEDALGYLGEQSPSLVIIDIVLPGTIDGIELANAIQAGFRIPFIFISSHDEHEIVRHVTGVAHYGFLLKPVKERDLLVLIETALYKFKIDLRLIDSEYNYRVLVENANCIIIQVDRNNVVIFFNEFAEKIFGYTRGEVLGKNVFGHITPTAESTDQDPKKLIDLIAYHPEKFENFITENIKKNGERVWVSWTGKEIHDRNGILTGVLYIGHDVTKRKKAEDELQRANRKLEDIIEFLPDAAFIIDTDKKIIAWNRGMERLTGFTKERMIGKGDLEYALPFYDERRPILVDLLNENDDLFKKNYSAFTRVDDSLFAESIIRNFPLTGGEIYLWAKTSPFYDEQGHIVGAIETIRDITEIRRTEMNLRESEEKFRQFFEQSADAQLLIDGSVYIDCNDSAVRLLNYSGREEIVGRSPHELSPPIQPDGNNSLDKARMTLEYACTHGSFRFEWLHSTCGGGTIFIDVTVTKIPFRGRYIFHVAWRDITAQKNAERELMASEELYRTIFESTGTAMVIAEEDGTYILVNNEFSTLTGYTKTEIENRMNRLEFIHPEDRDMVAAIHALNNGTCSPENKVTDYEARAVMKDGTVKDVYVRFVFVNGKKRKIASIMDISVMKRLEKEVLEIGVRQQQKIGQYLHDDLGQILTGTAFLCESLVRKLQNNSRPESEDAGLVLTYVRQAQDHASVIGRGLAPVDINSGGINAALKRLTGEVSRVFGTSCVFSCDDLIFNDSMVETQLFYIAHEAVTNAVKHGKAKKINIELLSSNGKIILRITDNGAGLPHDFDRSDGLGLKIMQYRAKAIGASFSISRCGTSGTVVLCMR